MILCKKRNFVFLRIPKTASTSICAHLISHIPKNEIDEFWGNDFLLETNCNYTYSNYFDKHGSPVIYDHEKMTRLNPHCNKKDMSKILSKEEMKTLNFFVVIRNPVDRFLSVVNMFIVKDKEVFKKNINSEIEFYLKKVETDNLKTKPLWFDHNSVGEKIFFSPQINWIDENTNVLAYPHFEKFFESVDVPRNIQHQLRVNKLSETQRKNVDVSLIQEIERLFKDDVKMWESVSY